MWFYVDPLTHVITVQSLVNWEVESELWELMMTQSIDDWQKYMQVALERGWPLAILVQIREKTQNEIQHGVDQATPSIRRETNYVEQDESEETKNQNMGPQGPVFAVSLRWIIFVVLTHKEPHAVVIS